MEPLCLTTLCLTTEDLCLNYARLTLCPHGLLVIRMLVSGAALAVACSPVGPVACSPVGPVACSPVGLHI